MDEGTSFHKHVDDFNKLMMDLKSVDDQISDEDYTILCCVLYLLHMNNLSIPCYFAEKILVWKMLKPP